jgi:fibronectin-binding autotransporter adhesin
MSTHALAASSRKPLALSLNARRHGHARSCRAQRRLLFEPLEDRSLLAVFVWDGAPDVGGSSVDANWRTGSNWVGDVAPSAGVDLIFPTGISANLASTNDFAAGTNFGVIQLLGNNYQLGGNGITLAQGVSNSGSGNDLQLALTLGATQTILNNAELTLSGGVAMAGFDLTFAGNGTTQVNNAITGAGNLIQQNGTTVLAVANSYDGTTTVTGGTLRVLDSQALGVGDGTAATETILNGGSLVLGAGVAMSAGERLHTLGLSSSVSLTGEGAGATWTGEVLLEAASGSYGYLYLQGTLTLEGAISDAGSGQNLLYAGGNVTLNGVVDVDYLYGYGSLLLNANTTATNQFYGNYWSTITIANATLSTPSYYSYYSNLVLDHGVLSYTTLLYGYPTSTWSGHGTVQNGDTFLVQNVSPGLSSGLTGVLQANNVSLSSSFTADLAGNTAGEGAGQHDQLQVHGTVQVGGNLAVNVASGYTPPLNQEYVLIDNDGADAISGTFTGLSEGSLLVVGTYVFEVSYQGGDGNDVSITRIKAAVWDGAPDSGGSSVDANWRTGSNWVGDVAPSAGSDLIFPTGISANLASTNDFAAGTNFGVIQLLGNNYQLGGNGVTLAEGVSNSGSGNDLQLALTLEATQSIINNSDLTLSGGVALAGFDLAFAGSGTTQVQGAITGAGNVIQQTGTTVLAVANSYGGTTTVTGGTLKVLDAQALGAGDGTAATETILNGGSLVLGAGVAMSAGERLHTLGLSSSVSLTGEGAGATWTGEVLLEAASGSYGYLYLQGTLTLEGAISDAGSGQNLLYAGGNVTLNGVVDVDYILGEGSLFVNANTTATNYFYSNYWSTLTIANATLSTPSYYSYYSNLVLDHGVLSYTTLLYGYPTSTWSGHGAVQNGSTFLAQNVSPGLSSGLTGVLQANNVSLSSSFTADLAGNTAGEGAGQHDQLQVTGTVQVAGNLAVNVAGVYTPPLNQEYVLIDNDGADAISGTFTGLSEGSLLVVGTYVFEVSYQGGDGNDVSITRIKAAVWDGAPDSGGSSVDANWRTGSNWVGDVAPSAGSDLIFPTGISANLASTNDFAAGTNFGVIQLLGNNYQLGGNGMTLAEGVSNSGSGNDLKLALTLGATQSIINNSDLTLSGGVALAGFDLTFAGNGTTQVNNAITGAGNLIQQNGTTVLTVANSYDGTTTVTGGTLRVLDSQALGVGDGTAATETILNGGSLVLGAGVAMSAGERLHTLGLSSSVSLTGEGAGGDLDGRGVVGGGQWIIRLSLFTGDIDA